MSEEHMSDDNIINYTQGLRRRLAEEMTKDKLPDDPKDRQILLATLADMDRTALGNKRINKDEEIANNDRAAADTLAKIYALAGNRDPYRVEIDVDVIDGECQRLPDVPEKLLEDAEFAPGEDEVGISSENYDEFAAKHGL